MRKTLWYCLFCALILTGQTVSWASIQTDIETANKAGKTVFLVVAEPGINGEEKAQSIAQQAHESVPGSTVINMNRADTTNKALVAAYRLMGAPLPVILVIASNGMVTGGTILENASPEKLAAMVPSPKKIEILEALQAKKAVIVVSSRKSMPTLDKVVETSQTACALMQKSAAVVAVDLDDTKEGLLLAQLQVPLESAEPVTTVINSQGKVTGTFKGAMNVDDLFKAATMQVAGGCCPGGGNKSCGPAR